MVLRLVDADVMLNPSFGSFVSLKWPLKKLTCINISILKIVLLTFLENLSQIAKKLIKDLFLTGYTKFHSFCGSL